MFGIGPATIIIQASNQETRQLLVRPQEATVIFCLLFDHEDQLIAAAPASDVHLYGKRYWTEVYGLVSAPPVDWQVASLAVTDLELVVMLQSLSISASKLSAPHQGLHLFAYQVVHTQAPGRDGIDRLGVFVGNPDHVHVDGEGIVIGSAQLAGTAIR